MFGGIMLKTENHNVLLQAFENYIRQSDFTHRKITLHDNPKNRELRKTKGKERSRWARVVNSYYTPFILF